MLTTIGILGTFVGIVIGLLDFRPTDVDSSIGRLLDGLKTAFITSLVGMLLSVIYKVLTMTPILAPTRLTLPNEVGPEAILHELQKQSQVLELLPDVRDAIAGAEESSLAGQLKLFRTDFQDARREDQARRSTFESSLWTKLDEFGEQLSKSATEQVIKALEQVIADFNTNLVEQFGENFKALDSSVAKLVEWQEGYRIQLMELHRLYERSVQATEDAERAVSSISESAKTIPMTMENLSQVISVADQQIKDLEEHVRVFADMRDRALEAIPETQILIQRMMDTLTASVVGAATQYESLLSEAKQFLDSYANRNQELAHATQESASRLADAIVESAEAARNATQETVRELSETGEKVQRDIAATQERVFNSIELLDRRIEGAITNSVQVHRDAAATMDNAFREQLRDALSRTEDGINSQFDALDKALNEELNRVLNKLGEALAQITGKFTEDYQTLVDAMDQIVRARPVVRSEGHTRSA